MSERLSKSQIDRLGERLKSGSPDEADLILLDRFRLSYGEAYRAAIEKINRKLHEHFPGVELMGRVANRPIRSSQSFNVRASDFPAFRTSPVDASFSQTSWNKIGLLLYSQRKYSLDPLSETAAPHRATAIAPSTS